jgi:hypothetical protein
MNLPATSTGSGFGLGLAVSGGTVLVGASAASIGATGGGAVYAFKGPRIGDLGAIVTLNQLRFLSLSHNNVTGIEPLAALTGLESLFLNSNAIGEISPALGHHIQDNGDAGFTATGSWQSNVQPVSGAFQGDYLFTPGVGAGQPSTASAEWAFTHLAPGTYRVWVTWPAAESRPSDARYTLLDDATVRSAVTANQRFDPAGSSLGGRAWQSLGIVQVDSGTLRVQLTNAAQAGAIVAADAVRIVAVDPATGQDRVWMPSLTTLNLKGNPLNDHALDIHIPVLQQQLGAPPVTLRAPSGEPGATPSASFSFSISNPFSPTRLYPKFVSGKIGAGAARALGRSATARNEG